MCYACTMIFPQQRIKYILVGAIGVLLGLYLLGQVGFNTYVRTQLYPALAERYGVIMKSNSARFNIFTSVIQVRDLSLFSTSSDAQDPYASFGSIRVKLHPSTWWFKHPIRVRSLEIDEGVFHLIRDRAGHLTVEELIHGKENKRLAPVFAGSSSLSGRPASQATEGLLMSFDVVWICVHGRWPVSERLYYIALVVVRSVP